LKSFQEKEEKVFPIIPEFWSDKNHRAESDFIIAPLL
jgi:hypothetical protein